MSLRWSLLLSEWNMQGFKDMQLYHVLRSLHEDKRHAWPDRLTVTCGVADFVWDHATVPFSIAEGKREDKSRRSFSEVPIDKNSQAQRQLRL